MHGLRQRSQLVTMSRTFLRFPAWHLASKYFPLNCFMGRRVVLQRLSGSCVGSLLEAGTLGKSTLRKERQGSAGRQEEYIFEDQEQSGMLWEIRSANHILTLGHHPTTVPVLRFQNRPMSPIVWCWNGSGRKDSSLGSHGAGHWIIRI